VEQDDQGDPQKTGPCGNEPTGMKTNIVTPFAAGDKVTIELHETIAHPGHFRVALATDGMTGLADPATTNQCANTTIQDPPVFPVLADGVLPHTSKLNGTQTIEVTLPSDVSCDNCTLQVLQYMSNQGNSCFYHHCAIISISPAGAGGAGSGGAPSAGAGGGAGQGEGGMSVASGGMSGTLGQGGMATSAGGMPSALGGQGSGGTAAPSAGGSLTAAGGMATQATGGRAPAAGGMPGTGGTTGGTSTATSGGSPTTAPLGTEPPAEDGGCSLSPASSQPRTALLGIASLLTLGLALARRRRR
jgi:MYXO-CTERM domain-containing protein